MLVGRYWSDVDGAVGEARGRAADGGEGKRWRGAWWRDRGNEGHAWDGGGAGGLWRQEWVGLWVWCGGESVGGRMVMGVRGMEGLSSAHHISAPEEATQETDRQ